MQSHKEHAKKAGVSTPCTAAHVNFGGGCLNCGWMPEPQVKPGTRCECRDVDCAAADDARYDSGVPHDEGWHSTRDNSCQRPAILLARIPDPPIYRSWRLIPMCAPCAGFHEAKART